MENIRRYKITEIPEIRYNFGQAYQGYREVQVIRGWQRLGHYVLDYCVLYGVSLLVQNFIWNYAPDPGDILKMTDTELLIFQLKAAGIGYVQIILFYAGFEGFLGSTPGKMLLRRVVINEYGERPEFPQILLRTICRCVPFEPLSCFWPRGWHDQWSRTFVVSQEEADKIWDALAKMENEQVQREADSFREQQ